MNFPTVCDAIKKLRQFLPTIPIVLGGPHATLFDEYILKNHNVDYVVRGEGELSLPALLQYLEGKASLEAIPNLSYLRENKIKRNAQARLLREQFISELPPPNFNDLPAGVYQGLSIESSRGCPYDCSFCSTNYRKSYRSFSPEIFVNNLQSIIPYVHKSKCEMIHIVDDEFTMNNKRAISIMEEINKRSIDVKFSYDSRANDLHNERLVDLLHPHTFEFLVGAECGYDEGLAKIGKGTSIASLEHAAKTLAKYGVAEKAHFSFIMGLPWEGFTEVKKTVSFAAYLAGEYGVKALLQWYYQIPGSTLWAEARAAKLVNASAYEDFGFFTNPYLFFAQNNLSPDQMWEVSDTINTIKWALKAARGSFEPIAYNIPKVLHSTFGDRSNDGFRTLRDATASH